MEDNNKEKRDLKVSTQTLIVLLSVLCVLAVTAFFGYTVIGPDKEVREDRKVVAEFPVEEETDTPIDFTEAETNTLLEEPEEDEGTFAATTADGVKTEEDPENLKSVADEEEKKSVKTTDKKDIPLPGSRTVVNKTTKPTTTQAPVKKPVKKKPQEKVIDVKGYWIQVGSFSTKAKASQTVTLLKGKGLSSRIELKTVNGKTVYRVRIGAYETRGEADKFCERVKSIKGFEDSYVSETWMKKTVSN